MINFDNVSKQYKNSNTPALKDINLNIEQVEEQAKQGAKVITFAHVLGNPPNMDELMKIVKQYNLILLFEQTNLT